MMNHHMPAGPGNQHITPAVPLHPHHSQRPREYHAYHAPPPQSPYHPYPYPGSYHPQAPPQYFHPHPQAQAYGQQQRWQPQPHSPYPPHFVPQQQQMQHVPYSPRSPMGMPMNGHPMTPSARQPVMVSQYAQHHQTQPQQQQQQQQQQQASRSVQSPGPGVRSSIQDQGAFVPTNDVVSPTVTTSPRQDEPTSEPTTHLQQHQQSERVDGEDEETQHVQAAQEIEPLAVNPLQLPAERRTPYYPKLPWYSPSASATAFPPRAPSRRKRRSSLHTANEAVALPSRLDSTNQSEQVAAPHAQGRAKPAEDIASEVSTLAAQSEAETPATSHAPSESDYTHVSTPTTPAQAPVTSSPKPTPTQSQQHTRRDTRTAVAVPIIPALPKAKGTSPTDKQMQQSPSSVGVPDTQIDQASTETTSEQQTGDALSQQTKPAVVKSWADLVRTKNAASRANHTNGDFTPDSLQSLPKNATLADALSQYTVQGDKVSFLEPRGLVNTGNMCYMNSILQVLVFCVPFYNLLDQVRMRTVHSIKSETPLLDAMIMFMREFKVLASSSSIDALRKLLKPGQLEQYGEPIIPEYVYDAIKHLPRFQSMRRGHQQDAEEFLGFIVEGMHDECLAMMQGLQHTTEWGVTSPSGVSEQQEADGWLEVGPKQKAAITRTAGQQDAASPVTKIFGGHLRSELRIPGQKDSVVLEPYKPLQLDIGAPHINNIVDALKGLTRTESLTGDFGGRGNTAKKQVFIDSLPPVLILHLKRFQYDNNLTGTQKIWKKIGYPLELEIPKEVFSPSKRGGLTATGGLPKYRLTSVVYHHGKSAAGGHYTVDVLRQDSKEWIRMDDTIIRRIRPEDVAEGGAEEDPKILAKALEQHKAAQELQKQRNMYEGLDGNGHGDEENAQPWSEVNGHGPADKKTKGVNGATATGSATPTSNAEKRTPTGKREGVKDNKVAYILLYERNRQ